MTLAVRSLGGGGQPLRGIESLTKPFITVDALKDTERPEALP